MHKYSVRFFLAAICSAHLATASAAEPPDNNNSGTLAGRLLFEGGKAPKGVTVTDTVIYLEGDGLASAKALVKEKASGPMLDQRDITFVPHVVAVAVGATLEIRNGDAILHNVHTTSQKNRPFNKAQLGNKSFEVVFDTPEIIHVVCDIHSQMSAWIVVVPTPYYTKAAKDGTFTLNGIPPGKYRLVGWHEKYGSVTTEVEVSAGKETHPDVSLTKASK